MKMRARKMETLGTAMVLVLGLSAQASAQGGAAQGTTPSGSGPAGAAPSRMAPSGSPPSGASPSGAAPSAGAAPSGGAAPTGPGAAAGAAADPTTVLGKLHHSNQMEIQMGKLAQEKGQAKEVKSFGKTLVTDHTALDKKVMAMAKQQKIELPTSMPPMNDPSMSKLENASGAEFDRAFAEVALEEHKRDIEQAKAAQASVTDPKLKTLLGSTIPILEKHRETAQKLVNSLGAAASAGGANMPTPPTPAAAAK